MKLGRGVRTEDTASYLSLIRIILIVNQILAMDVRRARVSVAAFRFFEVSGIIAKPVDVHTGLCLDEFETSSDGHTSRATFASDGCDAQSVNAIHSKHR